MSTLDRVEEVLFCLDCDYFTMTEDIVRLGCPNCKQELEHSGWMERDYCD